MALKENPRPNPWAARLHFFVRFVGLTGFVAAVAGLVIALVQNLGPDAFLPALQGESSDLVAQVAAYLLAVGGGLLLLLLIVEVLVALRVVAGRRSVFGFNATLQVALAVALLAGVNVFSFQHYLREDWTRDGKFTLPEKVRSDLSQLQGETTIVVYKQHKAFSGVSDTTDAFETAAEEKVVEKVQDLVEQFRELGPRFKVVVLDAKEKESRNYPKPPVAEGEPAKAEAEKAKPPEDTEQEAPVTPVNHYQAKKKGYYETLADLPEPLQKALQSVPENSVFFYAGNKVQRLSFNDIYRLDRQAAAGSENLVLKYQGVEPFARQVFNIDEKRPKIGIAVIHEWLTTEGPEDFGLTGLKKTLVAYGFDVRDVVLKKWPSLEPAAYTYEESRLDRLERKLAILDARIKAGQEFVQDNGELLKDLKTMTLQDFSKRYAKELGGKRLTEEGRTENVMNLGDLMERMEARLAQARKEREQARQEKEVLNVDAISDQRRMTDLKAKFENSLADCDLLFLPRMTLRNVMMGDRIPNRYFKLEEAQVAAIQDFLKAGKPVFACLGPTNEPIGQGAPESPDGLEEMLSKLGIKLGKQTVLYNVESQALEELRLGLQTGGGNVEVPPVDFDWKAGESSPLLQGKTTYRVLNPIRQSMQLVARSMGKENLQVRLRHPRPIYYKPDLPLWQSILAMSAAVPPGPENLGIPWEVLALCALGREPEIMMTDPDAWNEEDPFPTPERIPHFEKPKSGDATIGTLDEKRTGRFPIGVAEEVLVPSEWRLKTSGGPAWVRVAVIGQGGLFVGKELSPATERLFLNTANWLLGREDHLPREVSTWAYPRVELSERDRDLWHWGTQLGLPLLFAYLGVVVLLLRRLR
jgi:hypothetical protein